MASSKRERLLKYSREREWARIKEVEQLTEVELMFQIQEAIESAADQIRTESYAWYFKYAKENGLAVAEVKKRIKRADIVALSRKAKQYVKYRDVSDYAFSDRANREMKLYNLTMRMSREDLLLRSLGLIVSDLGLQIEELVGTHLTDMTEAELIRQAGILGGNLSDADSIRARAEILARKSFAGAKFSTRIWDNMDELKSRLFKGVSKSILMGKNPTTWMRSLEDLIKPGVKNARYVIKRIAVTETARVQVEAQRESYRRYGYDRYVVICESTACDVCKRYDGKDFAVENMVMGVNCPTFHPNCKCATAAYSGGLAANLDDWKPETDVPMPAGVKYFEREALRVEQYGHTWQSGNLRKAIEQSGGALDAGYLSKNGRKVIFDTEKENVKIIYSPSGGYYRFEDLRSKYSYRQQYLTEDGKDYSQVMAEIRQERENHTQNKWETTEADEYEKRTHYREGRPSRSDHD